MIIKTSELTGAALDWAVAKCEGIGLGPRGLVVYYHEGEPAMWQPSTDPSQAYPIIFREYITVGPYHGYDGQPTGVYQAYIGWCNETMESRFQVDGPTPLVAAMRCYVASKLGDEVDVPEELIK